MHKLWQLIVKENKTEKENFSALRQHHTRLPKIDSLPSHFPFLHLYPTAINFTTMLSTPIAISRSLL